MNDTLTNTYNEDLASKAKDAGCEAIYLPDESGDQSGQWYFAQNYDAGVIWKRLKLPWIALRTNQDPLHVPSKNLSRNIQSAESYLKENFPGSQIPQSLLKSNLREALGISEGGFDVSQGELLGLGVTRHSRVGRNGKQVIGQQGPLCLVIPSGELGTNISIAIVEWFTTPEEPGSQLSVPFLTTKSKIEFPFQRQIQQIIFPPAITYEDLSDIFAVRTMNEVNIMRCLQTEDKGPSVSHCSTLLLPPLQDTASKFVADTAFDPSVTRIATITDQGFWSVCDLSERNRESKLLVSGGIALATLPEGESRTGWWKLEWTESETILVAESKGIHRLNLETGGADLVLTPEKNEHFSGLITPDGLKGIAFAVLTTSEIVLVDAINWKILIRQKHRRDLDPSLVMKTFSAEDVTHIFLYSRLYPLITVHEISSDFPLNWSDTPFLLPLPRDNVDISPPGPNLGLVVIPSDFTLNGEDSTMITPDGPSFTTYRLQSGLGIVGDIYGTKECEAQSLAIKPVKRTEILSPRRSMSSSESEDEWIPYRSNWKVDFSQVGKAIIPNLMITKPLTRQNMQQLQQDIVAEISTDAWPFETMFTQKRPEMLSMDPDALTSIVEQIGHQLEEDGFRIRSFHVTPVGADLDPEYDPNSISAIHDSLIPTLPTDSSDLKATDIAKKIQAIREIAVDVGLANMGVLRAQHHNTDLTSFSNLRRFQTIDPSLQPSAAAKHILEKWGEKPQVEVPREAVLKKKRRVRLEESQNTVAGITMSQAIPLHHEPSMLSSQLSTDGGTPFTMSQPERGIHGTRLRKKTRRSGF